MTANGCKCQECGKTFFVDLIVPDEIWLQIQPREKPVGAGLLCGGCIMSKLEKLGKSMDESAKIREAPQGLTMAGAREPDFTLNLHQAYHTTFRIVTARSTIDFNLRDGKLGKVTQTETIKV